MQNIWDPCCQEYLTTLAIWIDGGKLRREGGEGTDLNEMRVSVHYVMTPSASRPPCVSLNNDSGVLVRFKLSPLWMSTTGVHQLDHAVWMRLGKSWAKTSSVEHNKGIRVHLRLIATEPPEGTQAPIDKWGTSQLPTMFWILIGETWCRTWVSALSSHTCTTPTVNHPLTRPH